MVTSLGGFLTSFVFCLAILIFDWRIGMIVFVGIILFLVVVSLMEKKSRSDVPKRQAAQAMLVETVLEAIQGMSVVKAFNLDFNKGKKVDNAIDESFRKNMVLEKAMNPYVAIQQVILYLFSVLVIFASVCFYLDGSMSLVYCLMMMVASFMVYEQQNHKRDAWQICVLQKIPSTGQTRLMMFRLWMKKDVPLHRIPTTFSFIT